MMGIDVSRFSEASGITDDVAFCKMLLNEENVFLLPGAAFGIPMFARIVFCAPKEQLGAACDRIEDFCRRHRKA